MGLVVCTFANSGDIGAMVLYSLGCMGKMWGTCFIILFVVFVCGFYACFGVVMGLLEDEFVFCLLGLL